MTALIPSFAGILFLILGFLAHREFYRKHVMHVVVLLAGVLFAATVRGLMKLPDLIAGAELERPLAVKVQSATAILTFFLLVFLIRSFIQARLASKNAAV